MARLFTLHCLFSRKSLFAAGLICLPFAAHATTLTFDDLATGSTASPIVYSNAGGSGIDVNILSDNGFTVSDITSQGNAILSVGTVRPPITITFSNAISNFGLDTGDFGADADPGVTIQLYDGSNNLLDTVSQDWNGDLTSDPFLHLGSLATGVRKVVFSSGGDFPNSMYVDNVSFTPGAVPEPTTMVVLGAGLLALRRKKKR